MKKITLIALLCGSLLALTPGCNRNALTGSRLTLANYDQVTNGMTKAQVERIMGPPTATETKDMLIFKKTTYRYEQGSKFALFTFKNDRARQQGEQSRHAVICDRLVRSVFFGNKTRLTTVNPLNDNSAS